MRLINFSPEVHFIIFAKRPIYFRDTPVSEVDGQSYKILKQHHKNNLFLSRKHGNISLIASSMYIQNLNLN